MTDTIEFAEKMKRMRKNRRMNQETLAKRSGLSRSKIAAIESFERKNIKPEDAISIMRALKEGER